MRRILPLLLVLVFAFFTVGCGAKSRSKVASFNQLYSEAQYEEAYLRALEANQTGENDLDDDLILWNLQAGSACMASGEYHNVCKLLDQAENLCKEDDLENTGVKTSQVAGEVFVNRYLMDYDPTNYDKVLINTYKGMAFMFQGDRVNARVEFNRAYDRQRRSVEVFRKEIVKEQQKAEKKEKGEKKNIFDVDAIMEKATKEGVASKGDPHWKPYADFVNPYVSYISGLFWMLYGTDQGDYEKALDSMRRVVGMSPNEVTEMDLALAESLVQGGKVDDTIWVLFESGLGPELEEFRIDLPLFLLGEKTPVQVVSLALPRLKPRQNAFPHITAACDGKRLADTVHLASIDRVVETEFEIGYNAVIAKAVTSVLAKAATQYVAYEAGGQFASLLVGITNALTTQADLRMWTALPKEVQVARFHRPDGNVLQFLSPEQETLGTISLPETGSCIVYVRIPVSNAEPVFHVIPLSS